MEQSGRVRGEKQNLELIRYFKGGESGWWNRILRRRDCLLIR